MLFLLPVRCLGVRHRTGVVVLEAVQRPVRLPQERNAGRRERRTISDLPKSRLGLHPFHPYEVIQQYLQRHATNHSAEQRAWR